MTDERILVGVIGAPHGVRGEVRLKSYTAEPGTIAEYPVLWAGRTAARRLRIAAARPLKNDMLVVRFEGVADRAAAQALTNTQLFVARADLPATEADEFYHADLIGLAVVLPDDRGLGTVVALANFGAGDMVEVAPAAAGDTFYVPFTRAFVPTVDLQGGRLVLSDDALAAATPDEPEVEPD